MLRLACASTLKTEKREQLWLLLVHGRSLIYINIELSKSSDAHKELRIVKYIVIAATLLCYACVTDKEISVQVLTWKDYLSYPKEEPHRH